MFNEQAIAVFRDLWQILGYRIGERDLVVEDQKGHSRSGELLGQRREMEGRLRCYRNIVIKIRKTVTLGEDELAIFDESHRVSWRVWRSRKELIDRQFLNL